MPDAIDRLDDALDDAWEALRGNPVIDRIFYTASEAADFSVLWHTLGVAQAIAKNDPKIAIALSAALGVESALINGPVKSMFKRSRPVQDALPLQPAAAEDVEFPFRSRLGGGGCCRHVEPERWWCSVVRAGRLVATSRIHVRIHHASDVAGGPQRALLGTVARRVADALT